MVGGEPMGMAIRGSSRDLRGDGIVLCLDCGGGYTNVHTCDKNGTELYTHGTKFQKGGKEGMETAADIQKLT